MTKMFDIEEAILKCWEISEDLTLVAHEHEDSDEISNKVLGIKHVYEMRFNHLWECYEQALKEYYELRDHVRDH
jgi:hypothetical protein